MLPSWIVDEVYAFKDDTRTREWRLVASLVSHYLAGADMRAVYSALDPDIQQIINDMDLKLNG